MDFCEIENILSMWKVLKSDKINIVEMETLKALHAFIFD